VFGLGSNGVLTKVGKGPYRRFVQLGCRVWWTRGHFKFGICPIVQDQFEYGGDDQCVAESVVNACKKMEVPEVGGLVRMFRVQACPFWSQMLPL